MAVFEELGFTVVESNNISYVKYDIVDIGNTDGSLGTLIVVFSSGGVYEYYDVPEYKFKEFSDSSSKGGYFARAIKGQYECENVTEEYP